MDFKPVGVTAALLVAVWGTACSGPSDPSVEITSPEAGATIEGNVVELGLTVGGVEDGDAPQLHVFVDREPVDAGEAIPMGEPDVIHSADNPIRVTGLSVGEHSLAVVLGDKDHVRLGDAQAETSVEIEGPTLDATAAGTAEPGRVVQAEIAVEGVELVEPDEDSSDKDGSAGHLHLFVNKEPTPPGEPIPTDDPAIIHTTSQSVAFPADLFTEGSNTIWVVLGYADHTAFDPPVLDRIVIDVAPAR